jgi:hypothetical protein
MVMKYARGIWDTFLSYSLRPLGANPSYITLFMPGRGQIGIKLLRTLYAKSLKSAIYAW